MSKINQNNYFAIENQDMPNTYKHIYFDLDGTISDSFPGIENSIRFAFNEMKIEPLSRQEIKLMIGIPLQDSLIAFFKGDEAVANEAIQLFRSHYSEHGIAQSKLYAGVEEMLAELSKTAKIYLITAKPTLLAERLLKMHGIAQYFTKILGYSPDQKEFTKADLIQRVGEFEHAIMIGDKKPDIDAGRQVHIETCGVTYGYGTCEEISATKPNYTAHSVDELRNILLPNAESTL